MSEKKAPRHREMLTAWVWLHCNSWNWIILWGKIVSFFLSFRKYFCFYMRVCETTHKKVRFGIGSSPIHLKTFGSIATLSDRIDRDKKRKREREWSHTHFIFMLFRAHCTITHMRTVHSCRKWQALFVLLLFHFSLCFFSCGLSSFIRSHNLFWWKAYACVCMHAHSHVLCHASPGHMCMCACVQYTPNISHQWTIMHLFRCVFLFLYKKCYYVHISQTDVQTCYQLCECFFSLLFSFDHFMNEPSENVNTLSEASTHFESIIYDSYDYSIEKAFCCYCCRLF